MPLSWFLRLRRLAFLGITALILIFIGLGGRGEGRAGLPIQELITVLLFFPLGEVLFRVVSSRTSVSQNSTLVGILLILDVGAITALLYLTGGPTNPFSIFYLVQVVLSAVLLGSRWAWGITAVTTFSFGLLFFWHRPLDTTHSHHTQVGNTLSSHLAGMFWAYLLVAALVAYFLDRILREKRASEERAQSLVNAQQKLAIITTVTTDAAHRLGTPLATIALIVADLTSSEYAYSVDMKEDLALLQHEVMRCKRILQGLCEGSGAIQGEAPQVVSVKSIIKSVFSGDSKLAGRVDCSIVDETAKITVQPNSIVIALKALLKNAIEAQQSTDPLKKVLLGIALTTKAIIFTIEDFGIGMDEISLVRIKEPFFSTKQNGMGLGAYIADLVASQLRGSLDYTSSVGRGTRAVLSIPVTPSFVCSVREA